MANLPKKTVQKLAVLYALTLWQRGAYGAFRVHKTLFYADKGKPKHLFTFKRYHYGQYSDDVVTVLNSLQRSGRLTVHFDGPSERLKPMIPHEALHKIESLLKKNLPDWFCGLRKSFRELGYLKNDDIMEIAHDDETYTEVEHDKVIFESSLRESVPFEDLDQEWAEKLNDLVDAKFTATLVERFEQACKTPQQNSNWRELFNE